MADQELLRENNFLKTRIQQLEDAISHSCITSSAPTDCSLPPPTATIDHSPTLTPQEYKRYGRQMILPQIGLPGQLRLKHTKALIIGVGGLGCPASAYLAGAGIGALGLLDHDHVEISNLHRQILHSTSRLQQPKVLSALAALKDLNPHVNYIPHVTALTPQNACEIVAGYDVVLDCTDHPSLRYLVSDVCVLLGKPLVSASALRTEGQLIVLNSPPGGGPCYRCVWPRPPPAESVTSCGEGGVLGPVVGVMGLMQALEAIKLITSPKAPRPPPPTAERRDGRMLFFSAYAETQWRTLRMRGRKQKCVACGNPDDGDTKITREVVEEGRLDYVAFCGGGIPPGAQLPPELRKDATEARTMRDTSILVDVRDETQFGICSVEGSINVPFEEFEAEKGTLPGKMRKLLEGREGRDVVMLCRLGNDSQVAAKRVMENAELEGKVWDVKGGIVEWARRAPEDGLVEY